MELDARTGRFARDLSSQGMCPSKRSHGSSSSLHGGRRDHLRARGSEETATQEAARSSSPGDHEALANESRGSNSATSRLARAKRRIAAAQGRVDQGRSPPQREAGQGSNSGPDSQAAATNGESSHREARLAGSRTAPITVDSSSESEAKTLRSSNAADSESGFARWFCRFAKSSSSRLSEVAPAGAPSRTSGLGHSGGGRQPNRFIICRWTKQCGPTRLVCL